LFLRYQCILRYDMKKYALELEYIDIEGTRLSSGIQQLESTWPRSSVEHWTSIAKLAGLIPTVVSKRFSWPGVEAHSE
jgi:hypothetical protein